jgi:hypothetical protein
VDPGEKVMGPEKKIVGPEKKVVGPWKTFPYIPNVRRVHLGLLISIDWFIKSQVWMKQINFTPHI